MQRVILHLDLDAFFCAVEVQSQPELQDKPFAVGGTPDGRGVVASCSYPARKFGVRSAMPMSQALRLCPELIIVPHHFGEYRRASKEVMALLSEITPLIEQISIDEAFMDVTGAKGAGEVLARNLQRRIREELNLPCSFGVASNKLVAKIANNIGKDRARAHTDGMPNAITIVPYGGEAEFLAPLPIREMWGIGPKTASRLAQYGATTIGDIAKMSESTLSQLFGKLGKELHQRAKGVDSRPVETEQETKQVSKEITFNHDVNDGALLRKTLRQLCDGVGYRLRNHQFKGTTVKIKLRWTDFTTLSRQVTLERAIDQDDEIYREALALFEREWPPNRPVRLIGVGVASLLHGDHVDVPQKQLNLWDPPAPSEPVETKKLQSALDEIRNRFGEQVIKRASDLDTGKKPRKP